MKKEVWKVIVSDNDGNQKELFFDTEKEAWQARRKLIDEGFSCGLGITHTHKVINND